MFRATVLTLALASVGVLAEDICLNDEAQLRMCLSGTDLADPFVNAMETCQYYKVMSKLTWSGKKCPKAKKLLKAMNMATKAGMCLLSELGLMGDDGKPSAATIAFVAGKLPAAMTENFTMEKMDECSKMETANFMKSISKCKLKSKDKKKLAMAYKNVAPMTCMEKLWTSACTDKVKEMIDTLSNTFGSLLG